MPTSEDAFAATVDASDLQRTAGAPPASAISAVSLKAATSGGASRAAVLPRGGDAPSGGEPDERYATKRVLGAGGMGEVVLAEDRDIGRNVALKYLTAPSEDTAALARFVDEIRVVGSLEHPNIVPIHDVGVDASNRYYFVMKHVEGETLESIIEKLAAGDRAYHARFTFTARVQMFLALLRALEFAHSRGYVHRDIKPANVMIGRYGEVVLMDWGIAKQCKAPEPAATDSKEDDAAKTPRERLYTTRRGAIVGTPFYMSPEQARGDVDAIDERSDVYCATALFYELITLRHYLGERDSLPEVLHAIQTEELGLSFAGVSHPVQGPPPAELVHIFRKGMKKVPEARYQSAAQMIDLLEASLDGRIPVQCPFTFQKRMTRELTRFGDRHPVVALLTFASVAFGFVGLVVWAAILTLHAR
jgi:serine/threonine protein kinase